MSIEKEHSEFLREVRTIRKKDPRYAEEAFFFVYQAVSYTVERVEFDENEGRRHITGDELLEGICELGREFYGPLALDVFRNWGLQSTKDIGNVVFLQVQHNLLGASPEDSIQDFTDKFDLEQAFLEPYSENRPHNIDLEYIE